MCSWRDLVHRDSMIMSEFTEFRHLKYLSAIAETDNITRAAERLFVVHRAPSGGFNAGFLMRTERVRTFTFRRTHCAPAVASGPNKALPPLATSTSTSIRTER